MFDDFDTQIHIEEFENIVEILEEIENKMAVSDAAQP